MEGGRGKINKHQLYCQILGEEWLTLITGKTFTFAITWNHFPEEMAPFLRVSQQKIAKFSQNTAWNWKNFDVQLAFPRAPPTHTMYQKQIKRKAEQNHERDRNVCLTADSCIQLHSLLGLWNPSLYPRISQASPLPCPSLPQIPPYPPLPADCHKS